VTFTLASGAPVVVGARLAAGGQGEVFASLLPRDQVFKKYFPRELAKDPALERRLMAMIASQPGGWRERSGHITMAWPTEVVYEDDQFAGFLMPVIDMVSTVGIHRITNPSDRQRNDSSHPAPWMASFTWRYLVRAAANLAGVTDSLHQAGTVIGDFNDANVRVGHDARVTLLDCDSMQITDPVTAERFFCRVGRPEYTAPELLGADWKTTVREPSSDTFALAVHLYALLQEGEHPFRGIWDWDGEKPPAAELARRGFWACQRDGPLVPRAAAIRLGLLPVAIRDLFHAAFERGADYPQDRPSARQWHAALQRLETDLRICRDVAAHVYPAFHGADCPWCEHARRAARLAARAEREAAEREAAEREAAEREAAERKAAERKAAERKAAAERAAAAKRAAVPPPATALPTALPGSGAGHPLRQGQRQQLSPMLPRQGRPMSRATPRTPVRLVVPPHKPEPET
jgi:DNA-binding helix-hairpin-helix protein with protein kinase domain